MNEDWPVVSDGFGNEWALCSRECDLEVVRPGKVQCSGKCEKLHGWWGEESPHYLTWGDR